MRTVLMVAYHYPPEGGSSGVQRTLKFSSYLRNYGWNPIVLTAHPRAYRVVRPDELSDIPSDIVVRRAFALDTARHLAVRGRYFRSLALPDSWASWWPSATLAGLGLIRRYRPAVIWSTFPIATAHLIGWTLQRATRLPWVADFRDTMTEDGYPADATKRRTYRWIEQKTMRASRRAIFTTNTAVAMYRERYPEIVPARMLALPNGYDEDAFVQAELAPAAEVKRKSPDQVVLLHSGILYPSERDPRCFYDAIAKLRDDGRIEPERFSVILRATGHDGYHRKLIDERRIGAFISLEPSIPYQRALREMIDVDGLLVFQAANCNHQVPAKIYEYLRARRPILALTDARGDTAAALTEAGMTTIVPLDDAEAIAECLVQFLDDIRDGRSPLPSSDEVARHSRLARTRVLASLLDDVASEKATA